MMSEFKIPPVITLSGSRLFNFIRVIRRGRVERKYYYRLSVSFLFCLVSTPFRWFDHIWFGFKTSPKIESPVFIIGHWRSGTTFLHHLLCSDPNAAYVTTYQAVFPNNLKTKLIFKNFMRWGMPDKRPGDNVRLHVNDPQEDEFAFGNTNSQFHYQFFYFPEDYKKHFESCVLFNTPDSSPEDWMKAYRDLLGKAMINSGGSQLYVKNPSNSGRIKTLLKSFPDARFICIDRHPVLVYLSALKFFKSIFPATQLQRLEEDNLIEMIFDNYRMLMQAIEEQWTEIPKGQGIRIRFEDLEEAPSACLKEIYTELFGKPPSAEHLLEVDKLLSERSSYSKNVHHLKSEVWNRIQREMGAELDKWGNSLPKGYELVD